MRVRITVEVGDEATSRAFTFDRADSDASLEEINDFILDKVYSNDVEHTAKEGELDNASD